MPGRLLRTLPATLVLSLAPALAFSQSVRGAVTDAATAAPIPGVVITLLDRGGAAVGRALSNEQGEYRIIAPGAGSYRLRALRIGFSPVTSAPVSLVPGGDAVHQLALNSIPFSLDTVRVAGQGNCEVRPDSARQSFRVWEQARAALTATDITQRSQAINARLITYQRALDPRRESVTRQNVRVQSGVTRTPWRAIALDSLRRAGYVVPELDGSTSYFAPDLQILLSEEFLGDHCMRIATDSDPSRLGIAFEPTRSRSDVPGIEGTLWLDRKTSELRLMEFRYVNVSETLGAGNAGGEMRFVRMKNGAWVISGWNIRMPVIQTELRRRFDGHVDRVITVREIQVQGGELAMAMRGRDTVWARPPLHLRGMVTDSVSGRPLPNALVTLRGTALTGRADSQGRFTIPDVLPGEYTAEVATPLLQRIGLSFSVPFLFADSTSTLTASLPPASTLTRRVCPDTVSGILAGAVLARRGETALFNARVVAEWWGPTNSETASRVRWVEARPDTRGRYILCGLPIGVPLTLYTDSDSGSAAPARLAIAPIERIALVDVRLDDEPRAATFAGTVISAMNAMPLAGVEVVIPALQRSALTNEAGAFRLNDIPAGTHNVTLRRAGYVTATEAVTLVSSLTVERRFVITTTPVLASVQMSGAPASFEARRAQGRGRYLTREQLEPYGRQQLTAALHQLPGVDIARGRSQQGWLVSSRVRPTAQATLYARTADAVAENLRREGIYVPTRTEQEDGMPAACFAQIYIDGSLMNHGRPTPPYDLALHSAESVEAVEWYSSPTNMPGEYNTYEAKCGVLVLHLRR